MDKDRVDSRNIIVIILDVNEDNYKLGTKEGQLAQLYTRNQFIICEEKFLSEADVTKVYFNYWWSRLHMMYLQRKMQYK